MTDIAVPFFCALPASLPPWPGVVVVMEGNGMSLQLLRVCERLAAEGYATVAPDLFWRFGGSNPEAGADMFGALRHADGRADIVEAVSRLRALGAATVGITGFCMGGGYAYLARTSPPSSRATRARSSSTSTPNTASCATAPRPTTNPPPPTPGSASSTSSPNTSASPPDPFPTKQFG